MTAQPTNGSIASDMRSVLADSRIAAQHAAGALILMAREAPLRLVFASASAAATFGCRDLASLGEALFHDGQPGGVRMIELARTIEPDRPARLERLRFFFGSRSEALDFQCRKIGSLFVAVALPRVHPRGCGFVDLVEVDVGTDAATLSSPEAHRPRVEFEARVAGRRTVRFLWETNADNLLTKVSPEFARIVEDGDSLVEGRSLAETGYALGTDPDRRLLGALTRRKTFSGVELFWPINGLNAGVPVTFAGQPVFDAARQLLGYRGFGVIRADRLTDLPREGVAPEPIDTPPAASAESLATQTNRPLDDHAAEAGPNEQKRELDFGGKRGDGMISMRLAEAPVPNTDDGSQGGNAVLGRHALTLSENDAFDELANLLQARLADEGADRHVAADARWDRADHTAAATDAPALVMVDDDRGSHPSLPLVPRPVPTSASPFDTDIAVAMERLPMGVLVTRGGVALYANRTLLDLLGHADLDDFHSAGGLDFTLRGRDPGSLGDEDGGSSISIATAAGDILHVDGHLQAMNWGGESATLMSFRRSAEAEVARRVAGLRQELTARENEATELHAILDTATDGVAVLDKSGVVMSLNRSAEALFGLEQGDVIGEPFTTLLAPESHPTARDYLDGLKKNGVASVLNDGRQVVGRAGGRGIIPLFMTIGHLPQSDGTRFCAVLRDLTPWKRAERDLQEARRTAERASQMKSDFLARISHEIRTPMNAILGFAEVIMEERFGAIGNERYKEYLHDIHASGVHVMNIVNDLLDLSKIEAGKMELTFASVDANKVVSDCVALMQPQANRERVIIRMALAPRLPNIVADDRSLRQIILNILSNAVNYNEAGGQVIVSTALTDSGTAVLRIRDTGIGMSESDIAAALEPFRQLPTARKGTGTGLGLPLTKALADANRASFTIKSKKNEGTLVEIAFPSARVLTG